MNETRHAFFISFLKSDIKSQIARNIQEGEVIQSINISSDPLGLHVVRVVYERWSLSDQNLNRNLEEDGFNRDYLA